jgi:ribbon-helix-helix CopG family protein
MWKMRATTIRFPNDLWEQLEREARRQGISVAQYVRDAALYRLAYSAGAARDDDPADDPGAAHRRVSADSQPHRYAQ